MQWVYVHICLMSTCLLTVGYQYYFEINHPYIRVISPKFILNNPYYNETYIKTGDVYKQLIDITNFTFISKPQFCNEYPAGLLLLIVVPSHPSNYLKRMLIRKTWGEALDTTKTVFLLGLAGDDTVTRRIEQEINKYGDIVQGNFADTYRNLTYKHMMGLKWIAHHCPTAKYILKADDDVLVNTREMRRFLARELSPWGAEGLMACQVYKHSEVQRKVAHYLSKWAVTTAEYPSSHYPFYCAGWFVLYSKDVVIRLLDASQGVRYFWIDDVYVTGILSRKARVAKTSLASRILNDNQENALMNRSLKYVGQMFLLGPGEIDISRILLIWNSIPA